MAAFLKKAFTEEEIINSLHQIHLTKVSGPDSVLALFFHKYWHAIDRDVINFVLIILNSNIDPSFLNKTYVVLIPKIKNPKSTRDFRPISLCNVIFKIITKSIANRLTHILPRIIHQTHSAFVPGRLITDTALIAFETFYFLKQKKKKETPKTMLS